MTLFVCNVLLALIWTFLTGRISVGSLAFGFLLGYLVLGILYGATDIQSSYFRKSRQLLAFSWFFLMELLKSTGKVTYDILTPTFYMRPGIVGIPLDARTDLEITMLANMISLTPGTLSLDVSPDRNTLYIHAMYVDDPEEVREEIKQGLERRLLELLR